jgi:hypothetical protein
LSEVTAPQMIANCTGEGGPETGTLEHPVPRSEIGPSLLQVGPFLGSSSPRWLVYRPLWPALSAFGRKCGAGPFTVSTVRSLVNDEQGRDVQGD